MEDINNNTGSELIKAAIERFKNKQWLFNGAFKSLVKVNEAGLDALLKAEVEKIKQQRDVLCLISEGEKLKLKALDGSRRICDAKKLFALFINDNFRNYKGGLLTSEVPVQVYQVCGEGTFMDIFLSIPGSWEEKFLSQNQVIDFCESFPDWLNGGVHATFFLIKKNEKISINEKKPWLSLIVAEVYVNIHGVSSVDECLLDSGRIFDVNYTHRVVVPKHFD